MSALCEAAVILGAGRGSRLGKGPKALVSIGGRTFLQRVVSALTGGGIEHIVVVVADEVCQAAPPAGIRVVTNPHAEAGPLSSVRLGLVALERIASVSRVMLHPVDHPLVAYETIARLIMAGRTADPATARVVPTWRGQRGHPVLVCGAGLAALHRVLDARTTTLRAVLRDAGEVLELPVDDPGVTQNLNTPEDFRAAGPVSEGGR